MRSPHSREAPLEGRQMALLRRDLQSFENHSRLRIVDRRENSVVERDILLFGDNSVLARLADRFRGSDCSRPSVGGKRPAMRLHKSDNG